MDRVPQRRGDAPPVAIELNEGAQFYQQHSSNFTDAALPWVQASGVMGVSRLRIPLQTRREAPAAAEANEADQAPVNPSVISGVYDVELFFGLPSQLRTGENHLFEVRVNGAAQTQLISLGNQPDNRVPDQPPAVAGSFVSAATCNFPAVPLAGELVVELHAKQGTAVLSGVRLSPASSQP